MSIKKPNYQTASLNIQKSSNTLKFSISGLRGIYGKDITPENVTLFTNAFHRVISGGVVAIARDSRSTGETIKHIVIGSLSSLGRKVLDIGILPTPTLKAYVRSKSLAGGIMVSASHNPIEYNAFKFIKKEGRFFTEKDNQRFMQLLHTKARWSNHRKQGALSDAHEEAAKLHIEDIFQNIPLPKKMKIRVAIDTMGACGTKIAESFLKRLGAETFSIFPNILQVFPRPPEPNQNSLKKLAAFVKKTKADLGFGFDPDADRLCIVSSSGVILGEEYTLPLAAMEALHHRAGGMVVNLSSSWLNHWTASQFNRNIYLSKVGESHVIDLMNKQKAEFGGEGNGGVIDLRVSSLGRDSISAMAWILALLHNKNKSIDQLSQKLPKTFIKKVKLKMIQKKIGAALRTRLKKQLSDFRLNEADGLHFSAKEGIPWIHIRSSNTEPIVRIMAEAKSQATLKNLLSLL